MIFYSEKIGKMQSVENDEIEIHLIHFVLNCIKFRIENENKKSGSLSVSCYVALKSQGLHLKF